MVRRWKRGRETRESGRRSGLIGGSSAIGEERGRWLRWVVGVIHGFSVTYPLIGPVSVRL